MPRIVRFAVLVAGMAAAYGIAAALKIRDLRIFAEPALLVAGLVFAASIVLVGQTYHLSGDFTGAVLVFIVGTLAAAAMTGSVTQTVLALAAGGYWTWLVAVDGGAAPHWAGLLVVVIGGTLGVWLDSVFARVAATIALAFWVAVNVAVVADRLDWPFGGAIAVTVAIAALVLGLGAALNGLTEHPRLSALGHALLVMGLVSFLAAIGILQASPAIDAASATGGWVLPAGVAAVAATAALFAACVRQYVRSLDLIAVIALTAVAIGFAAWQPDDGMPSRVVGGLFVIAAAIWAIDLGQGGLRGAKALGLTAFGVEVLYLYVVTLGTLIDTALAFLAGGLLFIGLAFGLYRVDRRLAGRPLAGAVS